jgi:hypothetical protein
LIVAVAAVFGCSAGPETVMVPMRDGVELATDLYVPDGAGPFPTILYRTPYSKAGDQYHAAALNDAGIAVVGQDMRGRFASEGVDGVFTTDGDGELKDGYDTMAWIAEQPWSDGQIGTSGESALGIVQYMAATTDPQWLVLIDAEFATPDLYSQAMFQGGVRRQALSHNWLTSQGSLHFEDDMAAHPYLDGFWDSAQTSDQWEAVNTPGYHVGGWYDIFAQGTLDAFMGYQNEGGPGARDQQWLVMGPWTHNTPWESNQGELVYPDNAAQPPQANGWDVLFNHFLDVGHPDIAESPSELSRVQYYVMGDVDDPSAPGNVWRSAEIWPPDAAPVRLHLQPGGGLSEDCAPVDGGLTAYSADPDSPVPTVCGNNLTIDAGPCDQTTLEERDDVVVFETAVLVDAMEITGAMQAVLHVDIDRTDADLMVRLTDVYPDGRSMLIADGALRLATRGELDGLQLLQPGEVVEAHVDLWSTSIILAPGHRLRMSVSSSNAPRFAVNRNNGLDYPHNLAGESLPVEVSIHHDAVYGSYLELPDPGRDADDWQECSP